MTEELENLLARRCRAVCERKWTISKSRHGGRGLFSTSDIQSGELIFVDFPAVIGPKSNVNLIGCSVCAEERKPLRNCSKNCHLPVCSDECENAACHQKECEFLRSLNLDMDEWSPTLYKRLILIRSLWMSKKDRDVVLLLHANRGTHVDKQISALQNILNHTMKDEVTWLRHCCGVLDGTAFEVELNDTSSLKGLYPLSAMMNHNCIPNTRLCYTGKSEGHQMLVIASKFIARGEEISTSYCPLLWATYLRRAFLAHTKHFLCSCERCRDATEFGSNLAALKCQCGSILLPQEPLNFKSNWKCSSCGKTRSSDNTIAQRNLIDLNSDFPECNYAQIQLKIDKIFKSSKGNSIEGLDSSELESSLKCCLGVLHLIDRLTLGNTNFKDRLCQQLEVVVSELTKRNIPFNEPEIQKYTDIGREIKMENEMSRTTARTWVGDIQHN